MARVSVLVDGFNLYHSIDGAIPGNPEFKKYKWLNLKKLSQLFLTKKDTLESVHYFTALAHWKPDTVQRHKTYIRALETTGVQVVYGNFKPKQIYCHKCGTFINKHEEKQTDVNIAVHLQRMAYEGTFDTAIIVSGDSDLVPPIKFVKSAFPSKKIGVLIPFGRSAEELKNISDMHWKIKTHHLAAARFDDVIPVSSKDSIECPERWR